MAVRRGLAFWIRWCILPGQSFSSSREKGRGACHVARRGPRCISDVLLGVFRDQGAGFVDQRLTVVAFGAPCRQPIRRRSGFEQLLAMRLRLRRIP